MLIRGGGRLRGASLHSLGPNPMTTITISSGHSSSVVIHSGSTLIVDGGAASEDSAIAGTEIVSSGGLSLDDTIDSGGLLVLSPGPSPRR